MFKGFCRGFKDNLDGQVANFDVHGDPDGRDFKKKECIIILEEDFKEGADISTIEQIKNNQDQIIALEMKNAKLIDSLKEAEEAMEKDPDQMTLEEEERDD